VLFSIVVITLRRDDRPAIAPASQVLTSEPHFSAVITTERDDYNLKSHTPRHDPPFHETASYTSG